MEVYNLIAVVRQLNDRGDADSFCHYGLESRHILKPMSSDIRPYPYTEELKWKIGDFSAMSYMYYIGSDVEVMVESACRVRLYRALKTEVL